MSAPKEQAPSMVLTTSNGNPVTDNQHSLTAGPHGPVLLQDFHLIDKLAHFDRERIPERVVHAKGAGAFGYFEVTSELIGKLSKAKIFSSIGKKTPCLVRFSTVGGEKGSADTERDPRGFAIKFYTEEGNWDLVGNNTPIFFIRDPIKFPDFIHTQKRNPKSNLKDPDAFWDFLSLVPESIHQVTILFSDRGTPDGYRHMDGFSSHTLKLVNSKDEVTFVKFHLKSDQGIKNLTREQAEKLAGSDPDYATRDLFNAIAKGHFPSWTMKIQVMKAEDAATYRYNPWDVTKVWPHSDYPLIPIGKLTLNRNPKNFFAEIEQVAFSPSNMPPGIEPTVDRMLQGRLFSYPDTHRHRLGPNFAQIPVNRPRNKVHNQQRDGFMTVDGNQDDEPNYEPNSSGLTKEMTEKFAAFDLRDFTKGDTRVDHHHPSGGDPRKRPRVEDVDFVQAGALYHLQTPDAKDRLVRNVAMHLSNAKPVYQLRQLEHFKRADPEYGKRIESELLRKSSKL